MNQNQIEKAKVNSELITFKDSSDIRKITLQEAGRENCEFWQYSAQKWQACLGSGERFEYIGVYRIKENYRITGQDIADCATVEGEQCEDIVIFSGPATIVMWADGTKTVSKVHEEPFDPVKGFLVAFYTKHSKLTKTEAGKAFAKLRNQYDEGKQEIK